MEMNYISRRQYFEKIVVFQQGDAYDTWKEMQDFQQVEERIDPLSVPQKGDMIVLMHTHKSRLWQHLLWNTQ